MNPNTYINIKDFRHTKISALRQTPINVLFRITEPVGNYKSRRMNMIISSRVMTLLQWHAGNRVSIYICEEKPNSIVLVESPDEGYTLCPYSVPTEDYKIAKEEKWQCDSEIAFSMQPQLKNYFPQNRYPSIRAIDRENIEIDRENNILTINWDFLQEV